MFATKNKDNIKHIYIYNYFLFFLDSFRLDIYVVLLQ